MAKTIHLPAIVGFDDSPANIEAVADWHAEKAEVAETGARRLRHEVIEFRLRKLAHVLRMGRQFEQAA